MTISIQSEHFPISVNAMFANAPGKGRIRSKRYKEWAAASGWDCKGKGSITGPYTLSIILSRKKRNKLADLGNFEKCISDLLVTHGIVEDDKLAERISIEWGDCTGWFAEISPYTL